MNLSSVMGSEPLFMAYPFHDISILHYLSFIQGVLLSTFKRTHYGFVPGIVLPDLENHLQEEFFPWSMALMALPTRLVSRSAAYRLRRDLGSTTLCFDCLPLCLLVSCPAWQCLNKWSCDHPCKTFIIRVMDDEICVPAFVCCSRLIAGIVNVCIRRFSDCWSGSLTKLVSEPSWP